MVTGFDSLDLHDLDLSLIHVTNWNPRRVYALQGFAEVGHDLTRGYEMTVSDQKVTLWYNGVLRDCHVINHSNVSTNTLVLSFNLDPDTVMTVVLFARRFGGEEEWFFGSKYLLLPSNDPAEWGGAAAEMDDDSEDEMSIQRGARIMFLVAMILANNWFGERPIVPVGDMEP